MNKFHWCFQYDYNYAPLENENINNKYNILLQMIVLFLNLHKQNEQGQQKFQRFYSNVTKLLKQTIYYGTHYEEHICNGTTIEDYLYDQLERSGQYKCKQKFKSVRYIFIDGPINLPPWAPNLASAALFIRNCLKEEKHVFLNGFGHTALYYYLTTGFDKQYCIRKKGQQPNGKQDYFHEEDTGELYAHGKRVCNSGIQVFKAGRFFQTKSVQALQKGAVLPTKFHYIAFNSKNGDSLIKNIIFPFTFYEKHKVFCTPAVKTRAQITTLIETQDRHPIVYVHKNCLSTHLLCPETTKILANWLTNGQQVIPFRQITLDNQKATDVAFDNTISFKSTKLSKNCFSCESNISSTNRKIKPLNNWISSRAQLTTMRPQTATSSKSKFTANFEKPSVRCSGPYETQDHIKNVEQISNKVKLLGRSRMIFKSQMEKNQIQNFVQRTPSRPPSAHNFRDINKAKWIDKRDFFVT